MLYWTEQIKQLNKKVNEKTNTFMWRPAGLAVRRFEISLIRTSLFLKLKSVSSDVPKDQQVFKMSPSVRIVVIFQTISKLFQ